MFRNLIENSNNNNEILNDKLADIMPAEKNSIFKRRALVFSNCFFMIHDTDVCIETRKEHTVWCLLPLLPLMLMSYELANFALRLNSS